MFNLTKSGTPELKKIQDEVFRKLFVLWNGINWKDLNKPLYSGLAAAIYLTTKTNDSIPLSKPDQAKFWKTHFRTNGNEQTFLTAMQAMPEGDKPQHSRAFPTELGKKPAYRKGPRSCD